MALRLEAINKGKEIRWKKWNSNLNHKSKKTYFTGLIDQIRNPLPTLKNNLFSL